MSACVTPIDRAWQKTCLHCIQGRHDLCKKWDCFCKLKLHEEPADVEAPEEVGVKL